MTNAVPTPTPPPPQTLSTTTVTQIGTKPNNISSSNSNSNSNKDDVVSINNDYNKEEEEKSIKNNNSRPWYRAGGMDMNHNGMAINIGGTVALLVSDLSAPHRNLFIAVLLCCYTAAALTTSSNSTYCVFAVPIYFASLLLALSLGGNYGDSPSSETTSMALSLSKWFGHPAVVTLAATVVLAVTKVNICMSVCLHRYAAHKAFTCGPVTNLFLCLLGCLAIQGGPLWWASQHRCHHKYCDLPRDPHSPTLVGTEKAFSFFESRPHIEEEFVPRHQEAFGDAPMRLLDTWAWTVVAAELPAAYLLFGREGLFLSFTSGWICQSITLWFNIANHPEHGVETHGKVACTASDGKADVTPTFYLPFYLLDILYPFFGLFVMEGEHQLHHDHAKLAKRSKTDIAFWGFIKPLEVLGLVWNVIVE